MPNIKSAIKRVGINKKKALRNTIMKSALKTIIKKCKGCIAKNDPTAPELIKQTTSAVSRASAKGILHKNTAARRQSKLAKALNVINK